MRLVTLENPGDAGTQLGLLEDGRVINLTAGHAAMGDDGSSSTPFPTCVRDVIGGGPEMRSIVRTVADRVDGDRFSLPQTGYRLLAPVGVPPKLICAGLNYSSLAEKVHYQPGEGLPVFLKATSTVVGPGDPIVLPKQDVGQVLAEVELGAVIGSTAKDVTPESALDFVFGYTIVLDITAQSMMERDAYSFHPPGSTPTDAGPVRHIVMFRSKQHDTFTPMGPAVVTRDLLDRDALGDLKIEAEIDGEAIVRGSTADMLAGVPDLVSYISSVMTLVPGDVIATGHPGNLVDRPLRPGQSIESRISQVGNLTTSVEG